MGPDVVPLPGQPGQLPAELALPMQQVESLDRWAVRAAAALEAPVGLVSLVDVEGQFFPGATGLPEPWMTERWTPLTHSFCQHVVTSGQPLVVTNAHDDPLVSSNLAISDFGVIAYVGSPLRDEAGRVVGALCAIDIKPRRWTPEQVLLLGEIAAEVAAEISALS